MDVAHEAAADFQTNNGKIYTGNINVKGAGFSLFGAGWLGYADETMNMRVRINTRGLPGAVLYPVSKLLEYSSQGPLAKPVWKPRIFKPELAPPAVVPKQPSGTGAEWQPMGATDGGTRTRTLSDQKQILSLVRLPFRHIGSFGAPSPDQPLLEKGRERQP